MKLSSHLLGTLTSFKSRYIKGSNGVWQLEGNSAETTRCKEELLQAICSQSSPFVHYDDEPPSRGTLATCQLVKPAVWRVPAASEGKELLSWLYMGNWQLYVKDEPLSSIPDLCRAKQVEVETYVRGSGVSVIIDSFHDDNFWVVGLAKNAA